MLFLAEAETTGTFKYRKVELVKEGFDPSTISEPLWYFDPDTNKYEPLTPDAHETILSGAVKLKDVGPRCSERADPKRV